MIRGFGRHGWAGRAEERRGPAQADAEPYERKHHAKGDAKHERDRARDNRGPYGSAPSVRASGRLLLSRARGADGRAPGKSRRAVRRTKRLAAERRDLIDRRFVENGRIHLTTDRDDRGEHLLRARIALFWPAAQGAGNDRLEAARRGIRSPRYQAGRLVGELRLREL